MTYELKDCRTGKDAIYRTTVDIREEAGRVFFDFVADTTQYYCPHDGYNQIHSEGDACEVLIGSDPKREFYYEIEISAKGDLMLAKMQYKGVDDAGVPILGLDFVQDCFVDGKVEKTENGYRARVSFEKENIMTGDGEIFFNAYRLETDGGEMDKHLFALIPTMRPKFHAPAYFADLKDYAKG